MSLDAQINFGNVVSGSSGLPVGLASQSYIYVRWVGYLIPPTTGVYTIGVNSDDGANLLVGGQPIVSNLAATQTANSTMGYTQSGQINLTANVWYEIILEYQNAGGADAWQIQLLWTPPYVGSPPSGGTIQLVPSTSLSTASNTVTGNLKGAWWAGTSLFWYPTGGGASRSGYAGAWSALSGYAPGDEVTYIGSFWKSLAANINSAPSLTNANWQNVGATVTNVLAYNAATTYYPPQQAISGGNIYQAIATTTGNAPPNASFWLLIGPSSLDNISDGSVFQRTFNAQQQLRIANPNFEQSSGTLGDSNSGWTQETALGAVGTLGYDTTTFNTGLRSGKLTNTTGNFNAVRNNAVGLASAGDNFFIRFAGKTDGTSHLFGGFRWLDANGATISISRPVDGGGSTVWQSYLGSYTAPANTVSFWVEAGITNTAVGTVWIDDFFVRKVASLDNEVGDGTTYARMVASDMNFNRLDFSKSLLNKNLDNMPDGTLYGRHVLSDMTGNRLDFSKALLNKNLDNVPDGTLYGRPVLSDMTGNRIDFTKNLLGKVIDNIPDGSLYIRDTIHNEAENVQNANFELGSGTNVPGWSPSSATISIDATAAPPYGTNALKVATTVQYGAALSVARYPAKPGDVYKISGYFKGDTVSQPTIQLQEFNGAGTYLGGIQFSVGVTTSWTTLSATGTIPAGGTTMLISCQNNNPTGAGICWFKGISIQRVRSIDDEVSDGTAYKRTTPNEKTGGGRGFVGFDVNSRLAGSFRNNPLNVQSKYTSANPISQNGTTTAILVAASTIQFGDGQISYNSGSVDPGAYGTYYVYADDPTFAGGAVTYVATTSLPTLSAANGRIYFGAITTVVGGGGTGSGGGGGCPKTGTRIKFPEGQTGTRLVVPCSEWVRVELENGMTLDAVPDHPVYTDRGKTRIVDLKIGEEVVTELGMSPVTHVEEYQEDALKVNVSMPQGHLYYANGILSHNIKTTV